MKKVQFIALLLVLVAASGCVVRSLNPWLADDTKTVASRLSGTWYDQKSGGKFIFKVLENGECDTTIIDNDKKESRFRVKLHVVLDSLLMVAGPPDAEKSTEAVTSIPCYLLLKVKFDQESVNLYMMDLDSFGKRVKDSKIGMVEGGDKEKGFIVIDSTDTLKAFVTSQVKDPAFFGKDPVYTLIRRQDQE